MHALIIEQEMWVTLIIEDALRELGYTSFVVAGSHREALDAARACSPDLITAAVHLDSGSGLDAVREICDARAVPVVFVTATPWEVRKHDSNAVIVAKPFGQAALREGVARALAAAAR
jgi:DNA-binding response OmpR family regulator